MEKFNITIEELKSLLENEQVGETLTLGNGKTIETRNAWAGLGYMLKSGNTQIYATERCLCIPGCKDYPECRDGNG